MRCRRVCRLFNEIIKKRCVELSVCIRMPVPLVCNRRIVRPFYQNKNNLSRKGRQRSHYTCALLVWSNELKLIQCLPQLFVNLRTLRLHQNVRSLINIDIKPLVPLTQLKKLHLEGHFGLTNKSLQQLPQVERLVMLGKTNQKIDLWLAFPHLISYQFRLVFNQLNAIEKCCEPLGLLKLNIKQIYSCNYAGLISLIDRQTVLQNLEKLSLTFVRCRSIHSPLGHRLNKLKSLRKLNLNFVQIHQLNGTPTLNEVLKGNALQTNRSYFEQILFDFFCFDLYKFLDLTRVELRINGFQMTPNLESANVSLVRFLNEYPLSNKLVGDDKKLLDHLLADKLRVQELGSYPLEVFEEENLESFHNFGNNLIVYGPLSTPVMDNVLRFGQHISSLTMDLSDSQPFSLRFLLDLPCLQQLTFGDLPSHFVDELCEEIIPNLTFLVYLSTDFSWHYSSQASVVRLFEAFCFTARRNLHIKFCFQDIFFRKMLIEIRNEKKIQNVILYNI